MKFHRIIRKASLYWMAIVATCSGATDDSNLLSTALRLRIDGIAPVVVDPEILDLKMLSSNLSVTASDRSSAVSQLKVALEPRGLSVVEQDGIVWVTKSAVETDLSRQIALVISSKNYRQLAADLGAEARKRPGPRIEKLEEMAKFMAAQAELPLTTGKFIQEKASKIKSLKFMQNNAAAGSSLSPPDPGKAAALERDIDTHRDEIRRYFDKLSEHLKTSAFDPENPASAPSALFAIYGIVPKVVFDKIALDSTLFFTQSLEALLTAATALGFNDNDVDEEQRESYREKIDATRKYQILNEESLSRYLDLLQQAGLVSGGQKAQTSSKAALSVDAANALYNEFGDHRTAVRVAIGENILRQLQLLTQQIREGKVDFIKHSGCSELFLYSEKESEFAKTKLGDKIFTLTAYSRAEHGRIGAVTGLYGKSGSNKGGTGSFAIQLAALKGTTVNPEQSLSNALGSKEKIVQINTTDSRASLGNDMVGSIAEALDLIKNEYDPALYKSRIVLSFDRNYDLDWSGDSAGVAIALAALSRVRSAPVDSRIMVSGAVRQFGDVRVVGAIYNKGMAAIEAGALVILMPMANLGHVLNLPLDKLMTIHTITLARFSDAATITGLDVNEASKPALEAVALHNFALVALSAGKFSEAAALSCLAVDSKPDHVSAQLLKVLFGAAGIVPSSSSEVSDFVSQAKSAANTLTTNPIAIRMGSTSGVPSGLPSVLAAIIPDYTVTGASGEEAFDTLNDRTKVAAGQPANITIRTRNEFFTNQFINLSVQGKTVEEILKQLCELCEASYQKKGNAIVIDSVQSPVAADLAATIIPDFTITDANGEEALKVLAEKAAEVSGKRPNFVVKSKTEFFSQLSINLSMQNKTFKEILKQICDLSDAKVEQRGDSYFVTVPD